MTPTGDEIVRSFQRDGFPMLRGAFDPSELSKEIDDVLRDGIPAGSLPMEGAGGVAFHSVVMMCERTPVSLALLDDLAELAAELLDRPVLPGREGHALLRIEPSPCRQRRGDSEPRVRRLPRTGTARPQGRCGSCPARIARAEHRIRPWSGPSRPTPAT